MWLLSLEKSAVNTANVATLWVESLPTSNYVWAKTISSSTPILMFSGITEAECVEWIVRTMRKLNQEEG